MKFSKEVWDKPFKNLFRKNFPEQSWDEAKHYHFSWVAFHPETNEMVGFITVKEITPKTAFICFGAGNPMFRGSGLVGKSFALALRELERDYEEISLFTETANLKMNFMAKTAGFTLTGQQMVNGRLHNYYEKRGLNGNRTTN